MQDVGLRTHKYRTFGEASSFVTPLESRDTPAPKSDRSQAPSSQIHSESRNIKFQIRHGILIPVGPETQGKFFRLVD